MTENPDHVALAQSLSDPERFEEVFELHFVRLRSYLGRRVSSAVAEDLAAETFVIAFKQRAGFDSNRSTARGWLFGIATNLLRRHYRTEKRELAAFARTGVDPLVDEAEEADSRMTDQETARRLALALSQLSDADRDALLLLAWGDLTYEEIADATTAPVGTVKSRIARARRQIVAADVALPGTSHTPVEQRSQA